MSSNQNEHGTIPLMPYPLKCASNVLLGDLSNGKCVWDQMKVYLKDTYTDATVACDEEELVNAGRVFFLISCRFVLTSIFLHTTAVSPWTYNLPVGVETP